MNQRSHLLLACLAALLAAPFAAAQGALTPPGAPAPTMKSLDQLDTDLQGLAAKAESRVAIESLPGAAGVRYVVSAPGSYYLRGPLVPSVSSQHGIQISASNVVIDLGGQTLDGAGGAGSGAIAITVAAGVKGVVVRHGTIANWATAGVQGASDSLVTVEDLQITGGFRGVNGAAVTARRVNVRNTTSAGIVADQAVDCQVRDVSGSSGNIYGFDVNIAEGCTATGIASTSGAARGFEVTKARNCSASNISATIAFAYGFVGAAEGHFTDCRVDTVTSNSSTGYGMFGGTIADATVRNVQGSSAFGIAARVSRTCLVSGLTSTSSSATGMTVDLAESCVVDGVIAAGTATGIAGSATGCRAANLSGVSVTGFSGATMSGCAAVSLTASTGSVTGISGIEVTHCMVGQANSTGTATGISGIRVSHSTVNTVVGSSAAIATIRGINATQASHCTVLTVTGNTSTACRGIQADQARNCTVEAVTTNSTGLALGIFAAHASGNTVQRVTNANASGTAAGISLNVLDGNTTLVGLGTVEGNTISGCSTYAIYAPQGARIVGNFCFNAPATGTGILCGGRSHVTDNEATGFHIGYEATSSGCLFIRNTSVANPTAFQLSGGVRAGAIQVGGGVASDANANYDL